MKNVLTNCQGKGPYQRQGKRDLLNVNVNGTYKGLDAKWTLCQYKKEPANCQGNCKGPINCQHKQDTH